MTSSPGLRERKKARTRWAIQEHALRLFAAHGYEATTVDQIAAAAEISPSTFFRYFPTKEDIVVQDEYDDLFVEAFRRAGEAAEPVPALRAALTDVIAGLDDAEWDKGLQRGRLVLTVPSLRARALDNFVTTTQKAAESYARAAGLPVQDPRVVALTGAFLGILAMVALSWAESDDVTDLAARLHAALALVSVSAVPLG